MQSDGAFLEQYQAEKALRLRLLQASSYAERYHIATEGYNDFVRSFPAMGPHGFRADLKRRQKSTKSQLGLLNRYLKPDTVFLELGCGACVLCLEAAKRVRHVIGLDISSEIVNFDFISYNLNLVIGNACTLDDIPDNSVDVAYSTDLIEHLHPDDAQMHVREVQRVLFNNGVYICITPNRVTGPHDVSRHFGFRVADGLHLKEYSCSELVHLFKEAGFYCHRALIGAKATYIHIPIWILLAIEYIIEALPSYLSRAFLHLPLMERVLSPVRLICLKAVRKQ